MYIKNKIYKKKKAKLINYLTTYIKYLKFI